MGSRCRGLRVLLARVRSSTYFHPLHSFCCQLRKSFSGQQEKAEKGRLTSNYEFSGEQLCSLINLSELGLTVGTTRHYEFCRVSFRTGNSLQIFVRMVTVWPPSGLVKVHEKEHSRSHQFSRSLLKNVSMRCCFPWFRSFSVPLAYGESR